MWVYELSSYFMYIRRYKKKQSKNIVLDIIMMYNYVLGHKII